MIKITKTKSADTRSAEHEVTKEELLSNSLQHIIDVQKALRLFADLLLRIAEKHDWTKIVWIDQFYEDFHRVQKHGGDFKELNWHRRHVSEERHHLNDRVPSNVTLLDVLEWVADITMAGLARSGNVYPDALPPEVLERAYQNTIELLKTETIIEEDGNE